ncbi:hypothetical protein AAW01_12655 [Aurantiacibacter gangjinensis]|uniref:Fido domain-containing protein n=1 Tax=Aurantiacibacter gangjinensis TaxID=502682 RepID=A0A0G9MK12_9SPHN|nr:hypothetical protein AAW01_12655 [Aurantiacibacter gangjinensis]
MIDIQREQIELHGGPHGVIDDGLVRSALGRARTLYDITGESDILTLGVTLGLGLAKNHGFVDGNKRAGVFAMIEFMAINGYWLDLPNDTYLGELFEAAVAGAISDADLVAALDEYTTEMPD